MEKLTWNLPKSLYDKIFENSLLGKFYGIHLFMFQAKLYCNVIILDSIQWWWFLPRSYYESTCKFLKNYKYVDNLSKCIIFDKYLFLNSGKVQDLIFKWVRVICKSKTKVFISSAVVSSQEYLSLKNVWHFCTK